MKKYECYVGDFETTVYDNQDHTEVWASAVVKMNTEDVKIFHSIDETFDYLISLNTNIIMYYHNLKFDGAFWLYYLQSVLNFKQATEVLTDNTISFLNDKDMKNNSFKYLISDMGQWYTITIKVKNRTIELRDSLKLLPFSVKKLGQSFQTKHKKLDMEYTGFRYAGCPISDTEKEYIANDVLVVKEALEIMFSEGHNRLTIGACCLKEFKSSMFEDDYKKFFPDLTEIPLNYDLYGSENADAYIRKSYKGGWCYVVRGKENKIIHNGLTADVNSLYPSMMSSESGNYYPIGEPHFWKGNYIPDSAKIFNRYYFVRIKTRFYIKSNKLPCIQIKNNLLYPTRQWLETSDVYNHKTGKYYPYYYDLDNNITPATVVLTLTQTDFILIQEHYSLPELEILDGCWFDSLKGLFDDYIEKYKKIKMTSKGAKRELAKLFLNNLYGKMASSTNSSFKVAYEREDKSIGFYEQTEFKKKAGYIAIGSAITSYARNFTIRAAQKNYYGKDKRGFIYADTDSIHCDLEPQELVDIPVHKTDFCHWKLEAQWDTAIFTRQKTYIEHIVAEDLEPIEEPYYSIKCAGMPDRCKKLFEYSMKKWSEKEWEENDKETWDKFTEEEKDFVTVPRELTDFKIGLLVPSKLMPRTIQGGVVLKETTYEMR